MLGWWPRQPGRFRTPMTPKDEFVATAKASSTTASSNRYKTGCGISVLLTSEPLARLALTVEFGPRADESHGDIHLGGGLVALW